MRNNTLILILISTAMVSFSCKCLNYSRQVVYRVNPENCICEIEMTERIIDSIRTTNVSDSTMLAEFAKQYIGTDTCDCKYVGIANISENEKKIIFKCDNITTKINGESKIYGEIYTVLFNHDSISKITKSVAYFSADK